MNKTHEIKKQPNRKPEDEEKEALLKKRTAGLLGLQKKAGNQAVQRLIAQRKSKEGFNLDDQTGHQIQKAKQSGQALDGDVKQDMEQQIGQPLRDVHIHTDSQADELNQQLGARAFTIGKDVFFREGTYDPKSQSGRQLLAHELTHVHQQASGKVGKSEPGLNVRPAGDQFEQEADAVAKQAVKAQTGAAPVSHAVQRQEDEEETLKPRHQGNLTQHVNQSDQPYLRNISRPEVASTTKPHDVDSIRSISNDKEVKKPIGKDLPKPQVIENYMATHKPPPGSDQIRSAAEGVEQQATPARDRIVQNNVPGGQTGQVTESTQTTESSEAVPGTQTIESKPPIESGQPTVESGQTSEQETSRTEYPAVEQSSAQPPSQGQRNPAPTSPAPVTQQNPQNNDLSNLTPEQVTQGIHSIPPSNISPRMQQRIEPNQDTGGIPFETQVREGPGLSSYRGLPRLDNSPTSQYPPIEPETWRPPSYEEALETIRQPVNEEEEVQMQPENASPTTIQASFFSPFENLWNSSGADTLVDKGMEYVPDSVKDMAGKAKKNVTDKVGKVKKTAGSIWDNIGNLAGNKTESVGDIINEHTGGSFNQTEGMIPPESENQGWSQNEGSLEDELQMKEGDSEEELVQPKLEQTGDVSIQMQGIEEYEKLMSGRDKLSESPQYDQPAFNKEEGEIPWWKRWF